MPASSLEPSAGFAASRRPWSGALSTFVLLTITGLGLGALYFLVASGLSLIYGLMGVLNFAHGAFITFGAYAAWWLTTQISMSLAGELVIGRRVRPGGRRCDRGSRRTCLHPTALPSSDRAGARHGRSRALTRRARLRDLGRRSAARFRARLDARHDDHPRREHPQRPLRRDRRRGDRPRWPDHVSPLHARRADHPGRSREPRRW